MNNQKLENLLNLSLEATEEERERSSILGEGYNKENKTWELIIKYHGDLSRLEGTEIVIEDLIAGYAIVTIRENLIKAFSELEEVEYIEKPKRLFFEQVKMQEIKSRSCILPVTVTEPRLSGKSTILTVIDSGIDYENKAFRKADGKTRIIRLWDQSLLAEAEKGYNPPQGFKMGVEFNSEMINQALAGNSELPSTDSSGHGTAVTAIAASSLIKGMDETDSSYEGIAPDADLVIVKLGSPKPDSFPRTTELMRALTYAVRTAITLEKPSVINVSFGNTYGNHAGESLLERFVDNISEIGRNCVVIGSGNEGASLGHTFATFQKKGKIEMAVGEYELSTNVQIWLQYVDDFQIVITSPDGSRETIDSTRALAKAGSSGKMRQTVLEKTKLLIYVGEPLPYTISQEIFIDFIPTDSYIKEGVWQFEFEPVSVKNGQVSMYLPSDVTRSKGTFFFLPSPEVTLTIPSTARKAITVGAYNSQLDAYADFSGRGYIYEDKQARHVIEKLDPFSVKPDVSAPGVNVETVAVGGRLQYLTGTSFATPIVSGSILLLMEWGIVKGNDPFLYGEKVKAYLLKGARPLTGVSEYPNALLGWGALCVKDALPL